LELERKRYENANTKNRSENKDAAFTWVSSEEFFNEAVEHCEEIVRKMHKHFLDKIWNDDADLSEAVKVFKACKMFDPFLFTKC
jgi:ribosomal 50S subunit-associated protein YjgA (DUF615 family)